MHREEGGGSPAGQRTDSDKSFVKKVTSRVSGFIPTSLTKWFGSTDGPKIRHREDLEEDDDVQNLQPPSKRVKLPAHDSPQLNFASTPLHGLHLNNIIRKDPPQTESPVAGPSGIKTLKLVLPNVAPGGLQNGDKDSDSDESTSGYSSMPRIPSKEQVSEIGDKSSLTPSKASNRSLFSTSTLCERSLFTNHMAAERLNTSLSSRRPSFNTTAFRSPNFMDRTLSTKRIIDSPFYGGRTAYGGASAYSRNSMKPSSSEPSSCLRNFVQAKPAAETETKHTTLSKTARRILSTLEQYTDPSEDVKKIPNPTSKRAPISRPYSVKGGSRAASSRELLVPTVSDLLKMKMREQLQDSTVSVRELATTSKSHLNVGEEYKIRDEEETPASTKSTNKIKTKITSTRQKPAEAEEPVQPVLLPDVQLPISTLPSFDFTIPSPAISKPSVEKTTTLSTSKASTATVPEVKVSPPTKLTTTTPNKRKDFMEFKFSKPLILAENMKSIKAINNFKFSEPVNKRKQVNEGFKTFTFTPATNVPLKKVVRKNNGENGVPCAPAKELITTGSVMDVLGKKNDLMDKFKPAEGTWECKMCMIRNTSDKRKCIACKTPKDTKAEQKKSTQPTVVTASSNFGDKFKISSGQWECSVCMIRNDPSKSKCAACETPKQQIPLKPVNNCKDFGDKFKVTTDKWECSVCMVRNDQTQNACVACTTIRKAASGSKWECSTCLVRNEQDKNKCVACENPKPGTDSSSAVKKKGGDWECSTCLVKNAESKLKCVCCETAKPGSAILGQSTQFKFGIDLTQTNGHGFTFGIKPDIKTKEVTGKTESNPGFTFGTKAPAAETAPKSFSFGVPSSDTPKSAKRGPEDEGSDDVKKSAVQVPVNGDVKSDASKPVTFGVAASPAFSFGASPKVEAEKQEPKLTFGTESKTPTLTFGATTSLNTTNATATTTTTSAFGSTVPTVQPIKPTFTFNAPAKTDTTVAAAAPVFTFGTPTTSKPLETAAVPSKAESAAPVFKFNSATGSSNSTATFNFSAPSAAPKPAAGGFNFSSPSASESQATVPAFGATNANANTVFGSGSESAVKFGGSPAPSFGAPSGGFTGGQASFKTTPAAPAFGTATGGFGANAPQPPQNGVFNFGAGAPASSTTPKTGFNFGASPAVPSGGFNFGASSNNTQNSGGFKFSAPSATPTPTFNFTGGSAPNAFTAQPTSDTPKPTNQRVFRKALRRTQR